MISESDQILSESGLLTTLLPDHKNKSDTYVTANYRHNPELVNKQHGSMNFFIAERNRSTNTNRKN